MSLFRRKDLWGYSQICGKFVHHCRYHEELWSWFTSERFSEAGGYGCHRSVEKVMAYVDSTNPLISERDVANSSSSNDLYLNDVCTPLEKSICSINTWACGTGELFSPYKRSVTSPTGPFFSSIPWISQIFRVTSGTVSPQSHPQESLKADSHIACRAHAVPLRV